MDDVEDELTAPDHSEIVDPLKAKRGDRLEHGFVVVRVLGQGATARALLATNDGKPEKQCVLKVALTDDDNLRLLEEGKALNKIRSEFVIDIYDTIEIAGRTVLVLQQAGEESLAMNLRKYGVPTLDLLGRYGENLLSAVATLEHHGVVHRDIKPDNIGIHSLNKQQNQLILYDFSLTSAPLDNLRIGTPGYTDPFLPNRKSGKWDLAAERYSAGVTLYEMTLGENQLPQWGEGDVANPDATKDELVIDEEKFKPSVREGLVSFFRKSLHRDPDKRFDHAEEMRFAWQKVFSEADNQTITTPSGEEVTTSIPLGQAELDTLIAALDLSARARDALDGLNLTTVTDLLKYPTNDIHMMRGVGDQYRREIIGFISELRQKFPDVTGKKTSVTEDDTTPNLERLHSRVLGTRSAKKEGDWNVRCGLLNVLAKDEAPTDQWPSQFEVADALHESRAKVGQVLAADQKRWAKDSLQIAFRNDLFEQIQRLGGVVTVAELIDLTIMLRPATDTPGTTTQQRLASAISRAAVETEGSLPEPRFEIRRLGDKTLVSCTHELATFSETLGQVADRIAKADPLLPRLRVFQELYDTPQPPPVPGCQPFSNERLIKLATAMSSEASVSSRQEIYPRNMKALRALRLGIGALSGLGLGEKNEGFTTSQVHNRVSSRYPEAMALPTDPKELESMLQKVGIDVRWDSGDKVYRRRDAKILVTSGSSIGSRRSTATSTRHVDSSSPETVEARQTEDRLQHAYRDGGFLVLTVKPSYLRPCERNLLHRFPGLERVSFDEPLPGIFLADEIFDNARQHRSSLGDEKFFSELNKGKTGGGAGGGKSRFGKMKHAKLSSEGWDAASFEEALEAEPGSKERSLPVGNLVKNIFPAFRRIAHAKDEAYVELDEGLGILCDHAQSLGYDGLILFLDEFILNLMTNSANLGYVQREANKLVKLVESKNDDRLIKSLLLAALVEGEETLKDMTCSKLAALNHGSVKSRFSGREYQTIKNKFTDWKSLHGEIRMSGDATDPVISLELVGIDTDSIIKSARAYDRPGERQQTIKRILLTSFGMPIDVDKTFFPAHKFWWQGTQRYCDVLFENVCRTTDEALRSSGDDWKLIIDYPFDNEGLTPRHDIDRIDKFNEKDESHRTMIWLPEFFSTKTQTELGQLVVIDHLLRGNNLDQHAFDLSAQDRETARTILKSRHSALELRQEVLPTEEEWLETKKRIADLFGDDLSRLLNPAGSELILARQNACRAATCLL